MTRRELVLLALRGETTPRPAVICPGGMMSFAVTEVMGATGCCWPGAHHDPVAMARLAVAMQQATGLDNIGLPFCMTVEAEALGAEINYGTADVQPRVAVEPLRVVGRVGATLRGAHSADGCAPGTVAPTRPDRRPIVLAAIRRARSAAPDVAVVGNVVGPFSLAGQLVEAGRLLRAVRREPRAVHDLLAQCAEVVRQFALDQVAVGADVIAIADPTATGEILGAERYGEFAAPYVREVIAAVHRTGTPVILHICGRARTILPALSATEAEAISLDETADLRTARRSLDGQRLMGAVSASLLARGPAEAIAASGDAALRAGVDILAPACGIVPSTPVAHLRALAEAVG